MYVFSIRKDKMKPFLKWVGGKSQLINELDCNLPESIEKYIEPFVGGGALLFHILDKYNVSEIHINDINKELINVYKIIKNDVEKLIKELSKIKKEYIELDEKLRKNYYLKKRQIYNDIEIEGNEIEKASLFIFLNKTGFNGLYRVNQKGEFNVPAGKYKNPEIFNEENLILISKKLQKVQIHNKNYIDLEKYIDDKTFIYFDPPYRPINKTSSFTSYTNLGFDDEEQIKLAKFIKKISKKGAKILLSNSDPKVYNNEDNFFDELYNNFTIKRIYAKRVINSKSDKRGKITELLIKNY